MIMFYDLDCLAEDILTCAFEYDSKDYTADYRISTDEIIYVGPLDGDSEVDLEPAVIDKVADWIRVQLLKQA